MSDESVNPSTQPIEPQSPEAASSATEPSSNTAERAVDSSDFPKEYFWAGLAFGGMIAVGGMTVLLKYPQLGGPGALTFCAGLAIVLAAFGTRAHGKINNWNVAGAGAIAIALLIVLAKVPFQTLPPYAFVTIANTTELAGMSARADRYLMVGRPNVDEEYKMIIFASELGSSQPHVDFTFQNRAGQDPQEFSIGCVKLTPERIEEAFADRKSISLTLEQDGETSLYSLHDSQLNIVYSRNRRGCPSTPEIAQADGPINLAGAIEGIAGFFGSLALAGDFNEVPPDLLRKALTLLESDNPQERDYARDILSMLKTENSWEATVSSWDPAHSSYRADLGRLVGWVTAIDRARTPQEVGAPDTVAQIMKSLDDQRFRYVVALGGHEDSTMRSWASEFLSWPLRATTGPDRIALGPAFEQQYSKSLDLRDFSMSKVGVQFDPQKRAYSVLKAIDFAGCEMDDHLRFALSHQIMKSSHTYAGELKDLSSQVRGKLEACPQQ